MELRQLYYFVAVADTLNFSRAAQALYVSQSALSKQIAGLEEELGVLLFSRSRQRRVALTAAGETLLHEAKEILLRSEKIAPLLHKSPQNCRETKRSLFIVVEPRVAEDPRVHAQMCIRDRHITHAVTLQQFYLFVNASNHSTAKKKKTKNNC